MRGNHNRRPVRGWRRPLFAVLAAALVVAASAGPAAAAEGSIDHVESDPSGIKVLYSLPGLGDGIEPDLGSLSVTLNGKKVDATAEPAENADNAVKRTAILAIDVSASMKGAKFAEAKQAASVFLDTAPADLYVGIVTFAGSVAVAQQPTLDRAAAKRVVEGLSLSLGTRLYEGVTKAVETSGASGQRSVVVLSDGRDTSGEPVTDVTDAISASDVKVDVVALAQTGSAEALLRRMSDAGGGAVISATDPQALTGVFASEAQALARQILVTAAVPATNATEGSLQVSISAGGETFTDSAYVTLPGREATTTAAVDPTKLQPVQPTGVQIPRAAMLGGIVAAGAGLMLLLVSAFGLLQPRTGPSVEQRLAAYSRKGARRAAPASSTAGVKGQALNVAQKALENNKGFEVALGGKLDAAGMSLKPAEWLLVHAGVAFGLALLALLVTSGSIIGALVGLLLGAAVPWFYLNFKRKRRTKAFDSQLADTLQLMSGSLSAGLSLAQSVDTVVREGTEPIAGEFRRALVEMRLGVSIEDALGSVAERMGSDDFRWVVMAIGIQREVGGNLAELLLTVAATLREREYLRRQVKTLSAEGRLSAWILGGLPPGFVAYLSVANRGYLEPMFSSPIGWAMLIGAAVLMSVGVFWLTRMVKVEV